MKALSIPEAPAAEWLEAARVRSSRRAYDGINVDPAALDALESLASRISVPTGARVAVLRRLPHGIFAGIVGSYGRVTGAPSALAFVGDPRVNGANEMVGYLGEAYILEATRLGLDTCWIGGSFKPGAVSRIIKLASGERVFGVSPLGTGAGSLSLSERTVYRMKATAPKPRRTAEEIAPGHTSWPAWARAGIEAARLAPSAMNRQPWRFTYADGRVTIAYEGVDAYKRVSKRLDCGIAMLHFEIGARSAGVAGEWELLERASDVGRFRTV